MSLNWRWDDKMGKVVSNGREVNIYRGNAFMIGLNEWVDPDDKKEYHSLAWFFADEQHCKNSLGLSKGYDGIDFDWDCFELDMSYKESIKFVSLLAKAKEKGRYKDVRVILY